MMLVRLPTVLGDVLTAIQDSDSVAKAVIAKLRKDYGLNT